MKFFQRTAGILLLALCLLPAAFAQDNDTITVGGSGIAAPVFDALVAKSGLEINVSTAISGTDSGLSAFCAGSLDIALAARALNSSEEGLCAQASVNYLEVQLANEALAVVVAANNNKLSCVTSTTFDELFAPSAIGTTVQWQALDVNAPETDVVVIVPPANTPAYALLDAQTAGDGVRGDLVQAADYADVIAQVAADENAIGVVTLAAAEAAEGVKVLEAFNNLAGSCYAASAQNIERGNYPAANRLFAYVNTNSLSKAGVTDLLSFVGGADAVTAVVEAGYTPLSEAGAATLQDVITNQTTGRTFSQVTASYTIPTTVSGLVNFGGTAHAFTFMNTLAQQLSGVYTGVTSESFFEGTTASLQRYCNGELDVVAVDRALTEEETAACAANQISTMEFPLGSQAAVLVASAGADYLSCLTTAQVNQIWRAQAETPTTWNQVSESFPEAPIYLFAARAGDSISELVVTATGEGAAVLREPTESNTDVLYRAAAVANAGSGLTVMSYTDYERVLDNNQQNIQLVAVDSGNGCVTPSVETISDGSYSLTRSVNVLVNENSLNNEAVKAFVWFLFSDANFNGVKINGFVNLELASYAEFRETLQTKFDELAAAAAAPTVPEAPAEATAEATEEATAEATAEATEEATAEATEEATAEATPEAPAATEEATEEATAESSN